jgi:general secretion pathway protein G
MRWRAKVTYMSHQLGYYRPVPRSRRRRPSLWLIAGAAVALSGFGFKLFLPRREVTSGEARIAAASTDVASLPQMLGAFARDTGRYPSNTEGLAVLASPPPAISGWNGPYLQQLINDPWGHSFVYHLGGPKGGAGFRVLSMGGDGREGTRDDIVHGSDAAAVRITPPVTQPSAIEP